MKLGHFFIKLQILKHSSHPCDHGLWQSSTKSMNKHHIIIFFHHLYLHHLCTSFIRNGVLYILIYIYKLTPTMYHVRPETVTTITQMELDFKVCRLLFRGQELTKTRRKISITPQSPVYCFSYPVKYNKILYISSRVYYKNVLEKVIQFNSLGVTSTKYTRNKS